VLFEKRLTNLGKGVFNNKLKRLNFHIKII